MTIRWLIYAAVQCLFIWGAAAGYRSMNSGGYRAGNWALVFMVPFAAIPLLYGLDLLGRSLGKAKRARRLEQQAVAAAVAQARHAAALAEQSQRDHEVYDKIDRLVAYFVDKMKEVGNPGLTSDLNLDSYQGRLAHFRMEQPRIDLEVPSGCWRGESKYGPPPLVLITPERAWWYLTECIIYNPDMPGPDDESPYWWTLSSKYHRPSARRGELYPHIPFKVWEALSATSGNALNQVRELIVQKLTEHNPDALHGLRTIDES